MKRYIRSATSDIHLENIEFRKDEALHSTDPRRLAKLAKDPDYIVRYWVAENLNTPIKILDVLSKDTRPAVRRAVANNSNTSADILIQMLDDESDPEVISRIVCRWPVQEPVLLAALDDSRSSVMHGQVLHAIDALMEHRKYTPSAAILQKMSESSDINIRRYLVDDLWLIVPSDILASLVNDPVMRIRYFVAENPNTPVDILIQLLNDPEPKVQRRARMVGNFDHDTFRELALDNDPEVRRDIVKNSNTPEDILELLATDQDSDISERAKARLQHGIVK